MAFTKLTTDVENIQKLADRPQLSAQQLKAAFDGAGADIKQYLADTLVPELEAATAAESIGAAYIGDGDPHPENSRNVQAKLNYLYEQIKQTQIGQIPDRSIESIKIASGTLTQNELADGAVTEGKLANASVSQEKLKGGLLDLCPVGMGLVWWSDTLPSDKWMLSGGTLTPGTHDAAIAFFGGTTLPDVKGRVIVGKDTGTAAFNALYRTGGASQGRFTLSDQAYAKIAITGGIEPGIFGAFYVSKPEPQTETRFYSGGKLESPSGTFQYGTPLGGQTDEGSLLQPYIVANYIFKVL